MISDRTCTLDLSRLMRAHRVTIRELSRRMGISMKRIREIRAMTKVDYVVYCDFTQAVTGCDVYCQGRFWAMQRQLERELERSQRHLKTGGR